MRIRQTRPEELDEVMRIYARARAFMAEHDNPLQWGPTMWPPRSLVATDIAAGKSHVCETPDGRVAGVFFFDYGDRVDPCYDHIYPCREGDGSRYGHLTDGAWECDAPYGVVHRIASAGMVRGVGAACIEWALARAGRLRIDTHPDNYVLQGLLSKLGFYLRGVIYVEEDDMPRLAYERAVPRQLRATVLTDDVCVSGLAHEWGLSLHVRYDASREASPLRAMRACARQDETRANASREAPPANALGARDMREATHATATHATSLLLDFGQTDVFVRNASILGIDLSAVDFAVLSHAHYDHANGLEEFFAVNDRAPVFLSEACGENCWSTKGGTGEAHYIGVRSGLLEMQLSRMCRVPTKQPTTIAPGVHLVPHGFCSSGTSAVKAGQAGGATAGMYLRTADGWLPDAFAHELTLVLELGGDGLCVMSSCSHGGVRRILDEVRGAFPERRVRAFVGGLHLKDSADGDVLAVADALRDAGVERLFIGHCTGEGALALLGKVLPNVVCLRPGLVIEL
ncbi:MAG: MBL fold metallo-hydrolase [Atopobiaceae bacterium]|nr:MBL fold metallo-hydrolase [Atopobiaceae bacterium]